jgi:hypothetical protein
MVASCGGLCEDNHDESNKSSGKFHDDKGRIELWKIAIRRCIDRFLNGQLLGGIYTLESGSDRTPSEQVVSIRVRD